MKKNTAILIAMAIFAQVPSFAQNVRPTPAAASVDVNGRRPQDAYMLPWKTVMERDIAWKKRVWRNIDLKSEQNAPFIYNAAIGKENNLANLLVQGAQSGKYKIYEPGNDRFSLPLLPAEIAMIADGNKGYNAEKVVGYRIKEDWLWLQNEHRMVVRIMGIAPLIAIQGAETPQPAFWVYYPDAREYLAAHEVYNGGKRTGMNWDELFERGNFSSRSDKVMDTEKQ